MISYTITGTGTGYQYPGTEPVHLPIFPISRIHDGGLIVDPIVTPLLE